MSLEESKESSTTSWMVEKVKNCAKSICTHLNTSFNSFSIKSRQVGSLAFGALMGSISLALIVQGINGEQDNKDLTIGKITLPNDIYMKEEEQPIREDQLIPVGKLKGEIDGEFEAFYLAVDKAGQTYINHSPEFSDSAYQKSKGWEQISKQDLKRFEAHLHFIPLKSKGLKR